MENERNPLLNGDINGSEIDLQRYSNTFPRIFNRNGTVNIVKKSLRWQKLQMKIFDPFQSLVGCAWWKLIPTISLAYFTSWVIFAGFYYACPTKECLAGLDIPNEPRFMELLIFSVETQTTIGFGNYYPKSVYSQIVVIFQCLFGLIIDACLCGLIFAKFACSKPNTSIIFSEQALISKRNGIDCFMFRLANIRKHQLINGSLRMYFAHHVETIEGERYIDFEDMNVNTSGMVFFSGYPFVIKHVINDESPLKKFDIRDAEILVLFDAVDTSTSTSIQARFSYKYDEILHGGKFHGIVNEDYKGRLEVDFQKFNQIDFVYSNQVHAA